MKNLDISNLTDYDKLDDLVNLFTSKIEQVWRKNTKQTRLIKHFKQWWNKEYRQSLNKYRMSRSLKDWKSLRKWSKSPKKTFSTSRFKR